MLDGSQLAIDTMMYLSQLSGLLLVLGGIAFADLITMYVVKLLRQIKVKR